jgi:hypothetical protein
VLRGRGTEGAGAPERELAHGRLQLAAVVGELVDAGGGRGRQCPFCHDSAGLEVAQSRGEDVRSDAEALGEIGVALGTVHQLAYDEQCPALADQLQRVCDRTVLVIALHPVSVARSLAFEEKRLAFRK